MALLAHYKLDSDVNDSSGNKKNGVESGTLVYSSGKIGNAADFSGTEKYISLNSGLLTSYSEISVSLWINLSTLASVEGHTYHLFSCDGDVFNIYIATDDKIRFRTNSGDGGVEVLYSTALSLSTWYNIIAVYNGTTIELFIDGISVDSDSESGDLTISSEIYIGKYPSLVRNPESLIDEVKLFDHVLSSAEILNLSKAMVVGGLGHYNPLLEGFVETNAPSSNQLAGWMDTVTRKSRGYQRNAVDSLMHGQYAKGDFGATWGDVSSSLPATPLEGKTVVRKNNDDSETRMYVWDGTSWIFNSFASIDDSNIMRTNSSSTLDSGVVITSADEDLTFTFGRGALFSVVSDSMFLSHRDMQNSTNYAIRQLSTGATYINSNSNVIGQIGGATKFNLSTSTFTLSSGVSITSADEDLSFTFGRGLLDSRVTDVAYFSHRDMSASAQYALKQEADGTTTLNSVHDIHLATDNVDRMTISDNSVDLASGVDLNIDGDIIITTTNELIMGSSELTLDTDGTNGYMKSGGTLFFQPTSGGNAFHMTSTQITSAVNHDFSAGIDITGAGGTYYLELTADSAGKPTTNTWTISSDIRIKKNVTNYDLGLKEILRIQPRLWSYNGLFGYEESEDRHVGIVADEIEDIFPNTVKTINHKYMEDDLEQIVPNFKTFDSHDLTFALINAVKELNQKIENLEAKYL